jgi:Flp pilus assembly protein TadG
MRSHKLLQTAARFRRDKQGNVVFIFSLTLVPALLFIGAAIDYTHASSKRGKLQHAVDSAVLAAAESKTGTLTDAQAAGSAAFAANFPEGNGIAISQPTNSPGTTHGVATVSVETSFLKIAGINSISIGATAESKSFANATAIEVALVLDNTGSMLNDMPALKTAASNLTNTLFSSAQGNANFKMSVVPFVAAVNPGKTVMSANSYQNMDSTAASMYHGGGMRWSYIATNTNSAFNASKAQSSTNEYECVSDWGGGSSSGAGGTGSLDPLEWFGKFANEMFGITPAYAFNETPNTAPVLSGTTVNRNPKGKYGNGEFLPTGFTVTIDGKGVDNVVNGVPAGCDWLQNPGSGKINYFDLFNRIPALTKSGGVYSGWKGCVEARPAPYDVTDDAPGADPSGIGMANTKYVPYFAADESDKFDSWVPAYHNNYMDDGYIDPANSSAVNNILPDPTGTRTGRTDNNRWDFKWNNWSRTRSILKYNGSAKADIKDYFDTLGNHITTGPNANCPDEVLPLTNVKADVLAKINSLQHWGGGGTFVSEGMAWGLRTLSPNPPYSLGKPYSVTDAQKVIVLMTDGVNEVSTNNDDYGPIVSDYSAYGYLADGRMGSTFATAKTFLNSRLTAACNYAKGKPGVAVYTVLFRETNATTASLLSSCATSPDKAFTASDGASLSQAFAQIGNSISHLRLSQ